MEAQLIQEKRKNALLEEKVESLTAQIRALKKELAEAKDGSSAASKEGSAGNGVAEIANTSYYEYWKKLEEEEKQRRKEKRKMASSRRSQKGNTSIAPGAGTTIDTSRDENTSNPSTGTGTGDGPKSGKKTMPVTGDALSNLNINESPASAKIDNVIVEDADSVYSCSCSESSWDSDGSYSSSDWDDSDDEGIVKDGVERKTTKESSKKDAIKKMSSKSSEVDSAKGPPSSSSAPSYSKAPETVFEAPRTPTMPIASTFEEVEAQVKKWCQGKNVIDMLGHIPEVYHGTFRGNLGPFAANKRKPDSEFTYAMIRKAYLKVVKDIHPDKQVKESKIVQFEAKAVFEAVSDAMEKYKKINRIA